MLAAVPVEVLKTNHNALEKLALFGGVLGAVAALLALWIAYKAQRSGAALGRLVREEAEAARAERARRADPFLIFDAEAIPTLYGGSPPDQI